jgi:hypothetical protein
MSGAIGKSWLLVVGSWQEKREEEDTETVPGKKS